MQRLTSLIFMLGLVIAIWTAAETSQAKSTSVPRCRLAFSQPNKSSVDETILVLGAGSNGNLASSLIRSIEKFQEVRPADYFTASTREHPAWQLSRGHISGVNRNDAESLNHVVAEVKPSILVDAAGGHMRDVVSLKSIDEARALGSRQAREAIHLLRRNPDLYLVFISSQYANPGTKGEIPVESTFQVLEISEPISLRLYAEVKSAYEDTLLQASHIVGGRFTILRLGTLMSETYP